MPRWLQPLGAACLLLLTSLGVARADRRVALIVGNGAYQNADPLTNPVLDARAIRDTLGKLGFEVIYGEDLDKKKLEGAIGDFAEASREADVALAYYAGHGSTFGDVSYLVPVDAEFKRLSAMPYQLVPMESLLGELRLAKGIRIAIFDACRDNARERELKRTATRGGDASRGFTRPRNPAGLIVAYSTQYGLTAADGPAGTNSPFTAALLRHLPMPGADVRSLFFDVGRDVEESTKGAQVPAIEVSLFRAYALVAKAPEPVVLVPPPVAIAPPPVVPPVAAVAAKPPPPADTTFIDLIETLTDRDVLERLGRHPSETVRDAARKRLAALLAAQVVPAPLVLPPPVVPTVADVAGLDKNAFLDTVGSLADRAALEQLIANNQDAGVREAARKRLAALPPAQVALAPFALPPPPVAPPAQVAPAPPGMPLPPAPRPAVAALPAGRENAFLETIANLTDLAALEQIVAYNQDAGVREAARKRLAALAQPQALPVPGQGVLTHLKDVGKLAFSPSGRHLSMVLGRSVQLWNVNQGRMLYTLKKTQKYYDTSTYFVDFSPDGHRFVIGYDDGFAQIVPV